MTLDDKTQILKSLKEIEELNIELLLINHFKVKEKEVNTKIVQDNYTVFNLISSIKNTIRNFKRELQSESWPSLPGNTYDEDLNSSDLISDIQGFLTRTKKGIFDHEFILYLESLISYQRMNNFWYKHTENTTAEDINTLNELIRAKDAAINESIKKLNELQSKIEDTSASLEKLLDQKTKELQTLTANADKSKVDVETINEALSDSRSKKEVASEVLSQINQIAEDARKQTKKEKEKLESYIRNFEETQKTLSEKNTEIGKNHDEWINKLKFITDKEQFILQKEAEINDLTGFAAGVSLFHTFNERKKELQKPVRFWQWSVVVMVIAVIALVATLFHYSPATTDKGTSWGIFCLNTAKSLPAVILLYFAIRQYNKERTFQEEYAFKSSVALTINAFADKISERGTTGKDTLIMNSVTKVYETPNVMKEKSSIFSVRSKSLHESVKSLAETVKELKK